MNKLVSAFEHTPKNLGHMTLTENSALTHTSSRNATLDFFSKSGALRGDWVGFMQLFTKAVQEDRLLAFKALFHARDVRGGNGERLNFRMALRSLASYEGDLFAESLRKNLHLIPEYGRWDDLLVLLDSSLESDVLDLIGRQLTGDYENAVQSKPISLLAKWLPSENASSAITRGLAHKIRNHLGLTSRGYRQILSRLRGILRVVERDMSAKKFDAVDYSTVPSQAMRIYRKAFAKRDGERFASFIGQVEKGEVEIKTSTLSPVQIVGQYLENYSGREDTVLEALWSNLPDYINNGDILVLADTSDSMSGTPMAVAISLALYTAERNKGSFKNRFLSWSKEPEWQTLKGYTLRQRINGLERTHWHQNTDLEATFRFILKTAVENNVPQEDMPKTLAIISDMQFDHGVGRYTFTTHETIKAMYRNAGYDMPLIVYWNVRASNGQPVLKDEIGTVLLSGESLGAFKSLLTLDLDPAKMTPEFYMLEVLNSERYAPVTV